MFDKNNLGRLITPELVSLSLRDLIRGKKQNVFKWGGTERDNTPLHTHPIWIHGNSFKSCVFACMQVLASSDSLPTYNTQWRTTIWLTTATSSKAFEMAANSVYCA